MNRLNPEILPSKKNQVIRHAGDNRDIVVKKFSAAERFAVEKAMGDILQDSGLLVPLRLAYDNEEMTIVYTYIDGVPIVDLLEIMAEGKVQMIFGQICAWLVKFYGLTLQKMGCQYILGDIHLRNFIYDQEADRVYGLDFEECRPGRIETDAARLWTFILNYDPAFTERKRSLASFVKESLFRDLQLEEEFFVQEVARETEELVLRRGSKPD